MQVSSRIPTNARAIASPMPRAAPVISVIFPFNLAKIASRKHYLSRQLWARYRSGNLFPLRRRPVPRPVVRMACGLARLLE
jgi:hypothetical protein